MLFLLIIIFIIIIIIEVPKLIKQKYRLELIVYSIFLASAFVLTAFQVSGFKIPSPIKLMTFIVKDVLHMNYK